MKSSFAGRRKARVVGQQDDNSDGKSDLTAAEGENQIQVPSPTVKRPASSKPKHRSSLRLSFGPGGTSMTDDNATSPVLFTPKKSSLSRQATAQNALRKSIPASIPSERIPIRQTDDRPSYSSDYLNQLKSSTPSTPKDLKSLSDVEYDVSSSSTLDIASKFGSDVVLLTQNRNPSIPTDAEIQEKKTRRARLAKEQRYNPKHSSDSSDSGNENGAPSQPDSDDDEFRTNANIITLSSHSSKTKHPETRLTHDDEDVLEDYDAFTSDGRITIGCKAERAQKLQRKAEMRELIAEAEGSGDSADTDSSEAERHAAYEAAQTAKGMEGLQRDGDDMGEGVRRPRTPPKITPLPTLGACLERLRGALARLEGKRKENLRQLEEVEREREEVRTREGEIQKLLVETGERYERLRREAGLEKDGKEENGVAVRERGLESLGTSNMGTPKLGTPNVVTPFGGSDGGDEEEIDEEEDDRGTLGLGY